MGEQMVIMVPLRAVTALAQSATLIGEGCNDFDFVRLISRISLV
jgi:hypothetical protein